MASNWKPNIFLEKLKGEKKATDIEKKEISKRFHGRIYSFRMAKVANLTVFHTQGKT